MGRLFDYEKVFLEWKKRQVMFRCRYRNTPPGFADKNREQEEIQKLEEMIRRHVTLREYSLLSSYQAPTERFVGRDRYLSAIAEAFFKGQGPVILSGIGGIGKSAIARAYVKQFGENYEHVLFLSYNGSLQKLFCDDTQVCISNLRYSPDKYSSKPRYFREKIRILSQIAKRQRLLIVIDDWNERLERERKTIFNLPCDILITTRLDGTEWKQGICIPVYSLEKEEEWEAFFRLYSDRGIEKEQREKLYAYREKVKGHTLLMLLKLQNPELAEGEDIGFKEDLFSRFTLKKEERQTLCELSVMPVQGIRRSLYQEISDTSDETIEFLKRCLLIDSLYFGSEEQLTMHPVIAKAAKEVFTPTVVSCRRLLYGFEKKLQNAWNHSYLENQRYEPYVFAILSAFPKPEAWMARTFDSFVTWLWIQNYYEEAKDYGKRLIECVEAHYGPSHQTTSEISLRVAAIYYNSLDLKTASVWYRKAYDIIVSCKPQNEEYWRIRSAAACRLSRSLRYEKRLDEALDLIIEARKYRLYYLENGAAEDEEILKSERIALCCQNLLRARIMMDMGEIGEPEQIYLENRNYIENRHLLDNSFQINEFDTFHAELLLKKKDYEKAEEASLRAVKRAVFYRGESFKDTLICRELLADIYREAGKREEALEQYAVILRELQKEHPMQAEWIARICDKMCSERGDC